ncbi:MAG: DUF4417 domain-containing protein [Deltaproteobacteria bacterium]|nr:DUF4417 domain-containing protein [Deltaproteobacteria bacterium]
MNRPIPSNVWLGVTVECRAVKGRIGHLVEFVKNRRKGENTQMVSHDKLMERFKQFHPELVYGAKFSGFYEIPRLYKVDFIPQGIVSFEKRQKADKNQWLHFYTYDEKFECVWNEPEKYLNDIKEFEGVITPDFTVFRDFPFAFQIYNVYRGRALGHWWQSHGLKVIPNVRWGNKKTFGFAFEGIQKGGTVSVGSFGGITIPSNRSFFFKGFDEMLKRIQPNNIVIYGPLTDRLQSLCLSAGVRIVHFDCQYKVSHDKAKNV